MLNLNHFWDPERSTAAGATKAQVKAWETQHGVTLPKLLKKVLSEHDGGCVLGTMFRVLPLGEIVPADDEFWDFALVDDDEVVDHALVFPFAWDDELGGQYVLNFNAAGPNDEPSVMQNYSDPGDLNCAAKSLDKFFAKMLKVSGGPVFNWTDIESLAVLADETIDDSYCRGPQATTRNVLAQDGECLVLFVHRTGADGERMEKTRLPLPLLADEMEIENRHDDQSGPWNLHLEPEDSDGIVQWESQLKSNGKWKNTETKGVPIYVEYESTDKKHLTVLQTQLKKLSN